MMNSQRVTRPPALLSIGAMGLGFLKNHRRGGGGQDFLVKMDGGGGGVEGGLTEGWL